MRGGGPRRFPPVTVSSRAMSLVRFDLVGSVARVHFDDGRANAISFAALEALNAALDRARAPVTTE